MDSKEAESSSDLQVTKTAKKLCFLKLFDFWPRYLSVDWQQQRDSNRDSERDNGSKSCERPERNKTVFELSHCYRQLNLTGRTSPPVQMGQFHRPSQLDRMQFECSSNFTITNFRACRSRSGNKCAR